MICEICHLVEVHPERAAIGYSHCTSRSCVAEWRRRRNEAAGLNLMLIPKQGMAWVSDPTLKKTTGKSSGRQ